MICTHIYTSKCITQSVLNTSEKKGTILIVDDEPDVAQTFRIMLERYGFTVDMFTDPAEALKYFRPNFYDLLILYIKMPKMNGFELYTKMKTIDKDVRAFFLTALKEFGEYDDFREKVFPKFGERHFIQKPIQSAELLKQVHSVIDFEGG